LAADATKPGHRDTREKRWCRRCLAVVLRLVDDLCERIEHSVLDRGVNPGILLKHVQDDVVDGLL
jgi:hypothetical protein